MQVIWGPFERVEKKKKGNILYLVEWFNNEYAGYYA